MKKLQGNKKPLWIQTKFIAGIQEIWRLCVASQAVLVRPSGEGKF